MNILIVGGSRGVGAAAVRLLTRDGHNVIFTYHTRVKRADMLLGEVSSAPGRATALPLDLADSDSITGLASAIESMNCTLDAVVISAAGGMERGKPEQYAWALNADGPLSLVHAVSRFFNRPTRIVLVTSHEAHLFGRKVAYGDYARIAETKKTGELRLIEHRAEIEANGGLLKIVSADIVEDSPTAKLLELKAPGLLADRRTFLGKLPRSADVAEAVRDVVYNSPDEYGSVHFVWEPVGYLEAP